VGARFGEQFLHRGICARQRAPAILSEIEHEQRRGLGIDRDCEFRRRRRLHAGPLVHDIGRLGRKHEHREKRGGID
jgi:hypothetical protein